MKSPDIAPLFTSCSTAAVAAAVAAWLVASEFPAIPSPPRLRSPVPSAPGEREGGGTFQEPEAMMRSTSCGLGRRQRPSRGENMRARSCSASLLSASRLDSDRRCCRMTCWNSCRVTNDEATGRLKEKGLRIRGEGKEGRCSASPLSASRSDSDRRCCRVTC